MNKERLSSLLSDHAGALAFTGYALLTAVMTWPVVGRLATHVPGGTVDLWTHRWTYWWIKHAIAHRLNPFYTDLLFHPHGVSLAFHNIAWVNIALWLPLQAIVGGNPAYSLTFLIFCTLNGFAMFLLARELLDSLPAAFIAGVVYGFWPYTMSQFGHPNMKVTCWVPLVVLYLRRTLDGRRTKDALLAGLFLALTGLTRWQLLLMAALLFGLYLAWDLFQDKAHWSARTLLNLILVALVAGALMAPLALPVASAVLTRDDAADVLFTEESSAQTDLLAYVLPTPYHPFWNKTVEQVYQGFVHNKVFVPFLGYTALALALCGVVARRRRATFWSVAAVMYVALALGPQLRVAGQLYPRVPMPYRLIRNLFFVRALRVPNRFNLMLGLPMAMLVAHGLETLTRRRSRLMSILVTAVVCGLILVEYSFVPYHTERTVTPTWYQQLAQESEEYAVLDLPVGLQTYNKHYMFYQITHRKPLAEGKIARPPREAFAFLESTPFLAQLHERNVMDPGLLDVTSQLEPLVDVGIRYLVIHKDFASSEQVASWRHWLTFAPAYEDEELVVYRTDPQWNRDFAFSHRLAERVGLIRASASPSELIQGAVVRVEAGWGSSQAPDSDYEVCLGLIDTTGASKVTRCTPLSPAWPPSQWGGDEVVRGSYHLQVTPGLEPGVYALVLTLSEIRTGETVGQAADLGTVHVMPLQPTRARESTFGDSIRLLGYDLERQRDELSLRFYWRALRPMDNSYKVFAHLTDPASEAIVSQADSVPRNWTYPTDQWISDEVVQDGLQLPLDDVTPGRYTLKIGWYHPETGQRLGAYGPSGKRCADDAVSVETIEIE